MKFVDILIEIIGASVLYAIASENFSRVICVAYMLLYVFQLWKLFRMQKTDRSWVTFNSLFFIMLTFVTYLIPFLYLIGEDSQVVTIIAYNDKYIFKSLFLTSIAITCYKIGYYRGENQKGKTISEFSEESFSRTLLINKTLVFIALFVFWGNYELALTNNKKDISGLVVTIINCIYIFSLIISGYSNRKLRLQLPNFLVHHGLIYMCTFFIMISMLIMGDRYTPICLAVTIVFVINRFVHRFTSLEFLSLLTAGFLILAAVSITRNVDNNMKVSALRQENYTNYFQDVIPINLDFYLGLEWEEKYGYFNPGRIFQIMVHPIPFLPSFIAESYFEGNVSSGKLLTKYNQIQAQITNDESGIGTHAIVDVYISWGLIGVIVLFYLFGLLVGASSRKSNNIYYLLIYGCLVSRAIYVPRETLFTPYRDIVYILVLAFFILPKKRNVLRIRTKRNMIRSR